jgi:hypothetical protein
MIALGCLTELSRPLDERLYASEVISQAEEDEIRAAQTRYRRFIAWYQERYVLVIENELINPSYLFRRRLVDFAASIVLYAREQESDFFKSPVGTRGVAETIITRNILAHFSDAWAELSEVFLEVKKNPSPRLYYHGPEFKIIARQSDWREQFTALLFVEQDECSSAPLRHPALQAFRTAQSGAPSDESSSGGDDMDISDEDEDDDDQDDGDDESQLEEDEESDDVIEISSDSDVSSSSDEHETPAVPATTLGSMTPRPTFKRSRTSSASTVNKSPSSTHPAKRQR